MDRYNDRRERRERRDDRYRDSHRQDESRYRGSYRLDEDGHYSTYNQSGRNDMRHPNRYDDDQGGEFVYRRSRNLQDNDDYTERQYQKSYRGDNSRQGGNSDIGGRYGGNAGMRDDRSRYSGQDQSRRSNPYHHDEYVHHSSNNFDGDYRPDNIPYHPGENYGNMAGSLSYGYDGGYNSDPDYDRRYNPLTGEIRQRSGNYQQGQPRRYGPPDRTASNPDYDRY